MNRLGIVAEGIMKRPGPARSPVRAPLRIRLLASVALCTLLAAAAALATPAEPVAPADQPTAASDGGDRLLAAIVKVRMSALEDARTTAALGREREGSGIVIDAQGRVLTIGYLVVEAARIEITTIDGKRLPATLAGYDHGTGLAVLQPLGKPEVPALPLGHSDKLAERDPVLILPFGGQEAASLAFVASRRPFTGNWEYLLESAIYTTPPAMNWSGAALVNRDGELVGIGSLFVRHSVEGTLPVPGNLFVPVDILKPILSDLIATGRPAGPARPWLGLATEEVEGHLVVSRVSPESPAEQAGIHDGDIVVAVGKEVVRSQAELYRRIWALGPAGIDVPLRILQGAEVREFHLQSVDRLDYLRRAPTY